MLTPDEITIQWKNDSQIKIDSLVDEAIRTPSLHAKYLDLLVEAKSILRQSELALNKYRIIRTKYFKNELTRDELIVQGWEPYKFSKPVKSEIDDLLNADTSFNDLSNKVDDAKIMVNSLERIMDSLKQRDFSIGNATKLLLYSNGLS